MYRETCFENQLVFAEVCATVAEAFWQQVSECKWTVLEKLRMDTNINYHEDQNTKCWVIQGNMHQISRAQKLLTAYLNTDESTNVSTYNDGNSFNFSYIPTELGPGASTCVNVTVIGRPETEDKAVACDIIKLDFWRPDRLGCQSSSMVAALTVKEKYRTQQKKAIKRIRAILADNEKKQKYVSVVNDDTCHVTESTDVNAINVEVISNAEEPFKINLSEQQVTLLDNNLVLNTENVVENEDKSEKNHCRRKEIPESFKFSCKKCSFKSNRESHLAKHLRIHDKVNTLYNCDKCNFTTIRLSHLRRHAISHSQTLYNCDFCTYKSNELKLLARHVKVKHTNVEDMMATEEVLMCSCCSYKTTKPYFYQRHLRVHCADKKLASIVYQCDKCEYKTNRREHYIRHMNDVHTNRRPFLCDFCGKAFKRPDALKQHKQTHGEPLTEARSSHYKCTICQKKCRSHASLREHLAVHSNERSFLCEICGASFKTRSVQRKHVITIHKNPRSYSCHRCEKRFNTNFALRRHLRLHQTDGDLSSDNQRAFIIDTSSALNSVEEPAPVVEVEEYLCRVGEEMSDETNEIEIKLSDVVAHLEQGVEDDGGAASTLLYINSGLCDAV